MNKIFEFIKKYITLILAFILLFYYITCSIITRFSLTMALPFLTAIGLLVCIYYINKNKIDREETGPKFFHVFVYVASIFFFTIYIIVILLNIFIPKQYEKNDRPYQYIIVFGAGVSVDETKNVIINKRIDKAVEYAKRNKKTTFVLSGAKLNDEIIEEAYYMKDYMIAKGVEPERILVDIFSYNTFENINNSLFMIKEDLLRRNQFENIIDRPFSKNREIYDFDYLKIGFVSNDFHLWRINMMAKKLGINNINDIVVDTVPYLYLYYQIREVMSLFKAFSLGQLSI